METIRSVNANSLASYIVMHSGHNKEDYQIFKQIVITGDQLITVCRAILLYEARVTNSLLGYHKLASYIVMHSARRTLRR